MYKASQFAAGGNYIGDYASASGDFAVNFAGWGSSHASRVRPALRLCYHSHINISLQLPTTPIPYGPTHTPGDHSRVAKKLFAEVAYLVQQDFGYNDNAINKDQAESRFCSRRFRTATMRYLFSAKARPTSKVFGTRYMLAVN